MRRSGSFDFAFIDNLCGHLPEEELVAAHARFAELLDALHSAATEAGTPTGDSRFDGKPVAP